MGVLKNKLIMITGSSSGIGEACARKFAEKGARLLLVARRMDRIEKLAAELKHAYQTEIYCLKLDVSQLDEIEKAWQSLPNEWKSVDILVNNAGLAKGLEPLYEGKPEDWDTMIDTNLKGLLYVTHQVLPGMLERQKGHIVNLSSTAGHEYYPKGNVYCATKHAVRALSACLRMDLLGKPIRVSDVAPGMVKTEFSEVRLRGDKVAAEKVYDGMHALTSNDVADAVVYCASCPPHVNIDEIVIRPVDQASAQLVYRRKS